MNSSYQSWHDGLMTTGDQDAFVDETQYESLYDPTQTEFDLLLPTYHESASLPDRSRDVGLPPSIRAAVASPLSLANDYQTWLDVPEADASWDYEVLDETATDPRSFAQRSLQSARSKQQEDLGLLSADDSTGPSSDSRRDSGIGSSGDAQELSGSGGLPHTPSEAMRHFLGGICRCEAQSVPYHLLGSISVVACKHEMPRPPSTRGLAPVPASSSSSSSSDKQCLPCPLCPDKFFTGPWAQRNLNRHMEGVHAPCPSPDGLKHFRCSKVDCVKTFRRDDARLVHERRSHPELNRAPATRRKRSDEI